MGLARYALVVSGVRVRPLANYKVPFQSDRIEPQEIASEKVYLVKGDQLVNYVVAGSLMNRPKSGR